MDYVLGRKLRTARTEAGLSQQALAERLGITFQQIQKYEKGANRIAASRLVSIAAAVDQPISYFLEESKDVAALTRPISKTDGSGVDQVSVAGFFAAIENGRVRKRVVELLRTIAESGEARRGPALAPVKAKRKLAQPVKKAAKTRR